MDFVIDRVENNVGKGENTGNQHFLLFPKCFSTRFLFMARITYMVKKISLHKCTLPYNLESKSLLPKTVMLSRTTRRARMTLTLSQTSPGFYVSAVQVF